MKIKRRSNDIDKIADDVVDSIGKKRSIDSSVEFFSSGSTTLNLAISGQLDHGWPRARISNIIGDGSAGKTALAIEGCFRFLKDIKYTDSKIFPEVKRVRVKYNNREGVMDFPLSKMYGSKFKQSIEWQHSRFLEELGSDIVKTIRKQKEGTAILYVVDSWDAFKSFGEWKRFDQSVADEAEIKGSFNQEKNKYAQDLFEEVSSLLDNNAKDFTLFIISQTRDKIGVSFGKKKYRAGGAALDFYTHVAAWIREIDKLTLKKLGEERVYGIESEVRIERSKVWKPFRRSIFQITYDHGVDDIGSMHRYLVDRKIKEWNEFDLSKVQKFIRNIEKNNLEDKLRQTVFDMWNKIEQEFDKDVECRKPKCL